MIRFTQSACCRHHRGWRIASFCNTSRYQPDGLHAWQLARTQVMRFFLEFSCRPDSLFRNAASHFRNVSVVFLLSPSCSSVHAAIKCPPCEDAPDTLRGRMTA